MKKLSFILIIFFLFVFVGCSDKKLDEIDIPDTGISDTDDPDSTDSTSDSEDPQNNDDADSADSTHDSGDSQSDDDADSADSTHDSGDSQSDDDADSADSTHDSGDSQSDDDADSADSTHDSGDSQSDDDADSADSTHDSGDSQSDDDADSSGDPEGCTKIYLNTNFYTYLNGQYLGQVMGGSLGESAFDLVILELNNIETTTSYDLSSNQAVLTITQDYGESTQKEYVQESGTITVNSYNPENFEMIAVISAKLTDEDGSCIEIVSATVKAVDNSDKTETCADIKKCMNQKGCKENPTCAGECYIKSTPLARTQYNDLLECNEANSCNGNYRCWYEHCTEQEEICGMGVDSNYAIPYGSVTINGTFPYLHPEHQSEDDKITITEEFVLMKAFVTGTFGNNNDIPVIDPTAADRVFSYAQMSHFKAPFENEKNITLIQSYYQSDENQDQNPTPTVHLVTTITQSGDYTLGLGEWESEARIFVKGTKSDGTSCDHAFGKGTITISSISFPGIDDVITGETTKIAVSGEATLYSFKATPDYGGDISDDEWVACDPE